MKIKVDRMTAICMSNVHGQLSDGIWENSPKMEKYWMNFSVDIENGIIEIEDKKFYMANVYHRNRYGHSFCYEEMKPNGFYGKSEDEIRLFFADKIRHIVKEYCHDYHLNFKDEWNKDNQSGCAYIDYKTSEGYVNVAIGDAFKVSRALRKTA